MEAEYKTIKDAAQAELNIEKSRFFSHISHANNREEAEAFIQMIKAEYKDATHNVSSFVIGPKMELKWATDDGEPQGTAGMPILKVLEEQGITNTVVVVTRYFGGKKLGTGGLVRAYTDSTLEAIKASGLCEVYKISSIKARVDYSSYSKLIKLSLPFYMEIVSTEFQDSVSVEIDFDPERLEELKDAIDNLSRGQASIKICEDKIKAIPIEG